MPKINGELVRKAMLPPRPDQVGWIPRGTTRDGKKARAVPHVDARYVMSTLDAVFGPEEWEFDYEIQALNVESGIRYCVVKAKLSVSGVTKCDVGTAYAEPDRNGEMKVDRYKNLVESAVSHALKRAAVHFGVARVLYEIEGVWTPFDADKKTFTETPVIPPAQLAEAMRTCGLDGEVPEAWKNQKAHARGGSAAPEGARNAPREAGRGASREPAPERQARAETGQKQPAQAAGKPARAELRGVVRAWIERAVKTCNIDNEQAEKLLAECHAELTTDVRANEIIRTLRELGTPAR